MKIKILHYWTSPSSYDKYAELTLLNRQTYCNLYGYDLVVDKIDRTPKEKMKYNGKFKAIIDNLKDCDWLVWADVDLLFTNPEIRIEDMIDDSYSCIQSRFPTLTHDGFIPTLSQHSYFLHNGVMIFKNDEHSHQFLEWASNLDEIKKITKMYNVDYMLDEDVSSHAYWSNIFDWSKRVKLLDLSMLFSTIPLGRVNDPRFTLFRPGRFVLHLAAPLSHEIKYAIIKNYITLCEQKCDGYILPLDAYDDNVKKKLGL